MARRANSAFDRLNPEFLSDKPHCSAVPAIRAGTQPATPFFPDPISTTLGLVARRRFRLRPHPSALASEIPDPMPTPYFQKKFDIHD